MTVTTEFHDPQYGTVETATSQPNVTYINEDGLPEDIVAGVRNNQEIANAIEKWTQSLAGQTTPSIDVFNRGRWENARHTFAIMSGCAWAVENDDVLSTLADVTEGLAFSKCRFEAFDDDQEDVWNQWAAEIDIDSLLRQLYRELFKVSQWYLGIQWGMREYTVRDEAVTTVVEDMKDELEVRSAEATGIEAPPKKSRKGNRSRKKKFKMRVPVGFHIFDPTKIMPVGMGVFGKPRYAYIASRSEEKAFAKVLGGDVVDGPVLALVEGKYFPSADDKAACAEVGVDARNLWLLRADSVFGHTVTKSHYERFATPRLKSCLQIIEMKGHLRASDRAALIGATNFIVVITKGTDKLPAKPVEIENLREQARVIARMPVLVGDHRLEVKIVSPNLDNTLMEGRWQVLDSRLVFRALQTFSPVVQGGAGGGGTGVSEMSRVVARGLENRRHQLVRSLERFVFREIKERSEGLDEMPSLEFTPKRITLDFDADVVQAILKLRDRGDISRETTLEELDFDQDIEVIRRAKEKLIYDDVFQSSTPFSSPEANPFGAEDPAKPGEDPAKPPQGSLPGTGAPKGEKTGRPPGVKEAGPRQPKGTVKT